MRNLTDDGFEGSILDDRGPAELDVLAQWGGDGSIYFVRHSVPAGGLKQGISTRLMSISSGGGEPLELLDIATKTGIPVWNFTVSSEARYVRRAVPCPGPGSPRA